MVTIIDRALNADLGKLEPGDDFFVFLAEYMVLVEEALQVKVAETNFV